MYKSAAIRFKLLFPAGSTVEIREALTARMRKTISRGLELSWSGFLVEGAMTQAALQDSLDGMIEGTHFPNLPHGGTQIFVSTGAQSPWNEVGASHETVRNLEVMDNGNKVPLVFSENVSGTTYSAVAQAVYTTAHVVLLSP